MHLCWKESCDCSTTYWEWNSSLLLSSAASCFSSLGGFWFVQWRASSCCWRVTANSGSGPLSCCFNMANYFGGICHLRTIKPVRSQSWHPVWSTKCGVFRQVERAVRAGQFQSQKRQKWFQMTDLSKITFTFENAQTRVPSDSFFLIFIFLACFCFQWYSWAQVDWHFKEIS